MELAFEASTRSDISWERVSFNPSSNGIGLRGLKRKARQEMSEVSILLLMELAFEVGENLQSVEDQEVSILLLMELAFEDTDNNNETGKASGFNPSSNGIGLRGCLQWWAQWIPSDNCIVSILLLMELAFEVLRCPDGWYNAHSFNPSSNGIGLRGGRYRL